MQLARGARGMHFILLVERKEVMWRWSSEGRCRIGGIRSGSDDRVEVE